MKGTIANPSVMAGTSPGMTKERASPHSSYLFLSAHTTPAATNESIASFE
jgi:hypothetical protein